MSDGIVDEHTGVYRDGSGRQRRGCNHYGVNLFATEDDARTAAYDLFGGPGFIWRTDCGLFDFSAIPDRIVPWSENAELVLTPGESE